MNSDVVEKMARAMATKAGGWPWEHRPDAKKESLRKDVRDLLSALREQGLVVVPMIPFSVTHLRSESDPAPATKEEIDAIEWKEGERHRFIRNTKVYRSYADYCDD